MLNSGVVWSRYFFLCFCSAGKSARGIKLVMSTALLDLKAALDEVLAVIDARNQGSVLVLHRATLALLTLEDRQHELPDGLKRKFLNLLARLRENAWIQHPQAGLAEIKRFYVALLKAIQLPNRQALN